MRSRNWVNLAFLRFLNFGVKQDNGWRGARVASAPVDSRSWNIKPDRRLTLNDVLVWEVHMPTAWYIDNLLHCFSTGNQMPIDLLIAKGDEFHKQFMTLKERGNLEGQGLQHVLDIMQSYVVLTALPQE